MKDVVGDFLVIKFSIGYDKEGLDKKIRDFVDNYNVLIDEIKILIWYGEFELEEDGVLVGDFLLCGI